MTKMKTKAREKRSKAALTAVRGARKPVDLDAVRQQISDLVGNQAVRMVEITIAEADKGHYAAMKYLFELIGLFPATEQENAPQEDSLAKTLLRRLGVPERVAAETAVTKDCSPESMAVGAGGDAVK